MQAEAHSLRNELDASKLAALRQQEAVAAAEAGAAAAQQQLEAQREAEGVLQVWRQRWRPAASWAGGRVGSWVGRKDCRGQLHVAQVLQRSLGMAAHVAARGPQSSPSPAPPPQAEALSLRRALAEAQRKLHALSSDSGAMIDRRIVVKMLITYFEKDYSGGWWCGWVGGWVGGGACSALPGLARPCSALPGLARPCPALPGLGGWRGELALYRCMRGLGGVAGEWFAPAALLWSSAAPLPTHPPPTHHPPTHPQARCWT